MNQEILRLSDYQKGYECVDGNNALRVDLDEIGEEIEEKHYFYDVKKTEKKVIAKVFLEEKRSKKVTERITTSDLYYESQIEIDEWKFNEFSEAEKKATVNEFVLGKKGFNLIIWISPEGGVYEEGRLNIGFPVFGEKEWSIYGKHMPLFWNKEESMELARRLLKNGGISLEKIEDTEDLRRQPIGFKIDNIDEWIEKCRQLIPEFDEVWRFIEEGKDIEGQLKLEKDVEIAIEAAGGNNYLFERIMMEMGNEINSEGSHGGSWLGENREESKTGIIVSVGSDGKVEKSFGSTEGLTHCNDCGCYYSGDKCPLCNRKSDLLMAA